MKYTQFVLLVFALCLNACSENDKGKTFKKAFDKMEINEIHKLVRNFDDHILQTSSESSLEQAYDQYLSKISKSKTMAEFKRDVNISGNKREKILAPINNAFKSEIWTIGSGQEDYSSNIKAINTKGKYIKFLNMLKQKEPMLNAYCESIVTAGDIAPSSYSIITEIQDKLDIEDTEIRFLIAVHYLSLR